MNIDNIKKSISEMYRDEALNIILNIRKSRRQSKKPDPIRRKSDVSVNIEKMLSSLSESDLLDILKSI